MVTGLGLLRLLEALKRRLCGVNTGQCLTDLLVLKATDVVLTEALHISYDRVRIKGSGGSDSRYLP